MSTTVRHLPIHRQLTHLLIREATLGVRDRVHRGEVRLHATMDADRMLERHPEIAGMNDRQLQAAVAEFIA